MAKKEKEYLFLCVGKDCEKSGSDEVKQNLKKQLKAQGLKKKIRLVRTHCMDSCKKGPNIVFRGRIYHGISPSGAENLLEVMMGEIRGQDVSEH